MAHEHEPPPLLCICYECALYVFLVVFKIIILLLNRLGIKIYFVCNLFGNSYWKWKEVHSTAVNNYLCTVGVITCEHTCCALIIIISY